MVRGARSVAASVVVAGIAFQVGGAGKTQSGDRRPTASLLGSAREAIGGEAKLRNVRSLVMQGTMRSGFNGVTAQLLDPRPVEYRILFPDNFLRISGDELIQERTGCAGALSLNGLKPLTSDAHVNYAGGPMDVRNAQLMFARLAIGLLAETRTVLPVTVRAAAADARHLTLSISEPNGFLGFLDVDRTSHLPLRLRYEQRVQFRRPLTAEEIKAGVMNPRDLKSETAEMSLTFDDRRPVEGLSLPFRITRIARGVVFEEIQLQRIIVNPPLTVKDFKDMQP